MKKIKLSHILPALAILALYSLFMVFSACDNGTSPKTGMLSGRVELVNDTGNPELDPDDFAGVTITGFSDINLVDGLDEARDDYPQTGFTLNDHGLLGTYGRQPEFSAISAVDGTFIIPTISYGSWVIKFSKDGWNDRFVRISIENNESEQINTTLYPLIEVGNSWQGDLVIEPNHELRITNDFVLLGNLIAEGAGLVRISDNVRVIIQGSIINVTEDMLIFSGYAANSEGYYQVELIDPENDVKNCVFSNAKNGLVITSSSNLVSVKESFFYNCETGLRNSSNSWVDVEQNVFANCNSLSVTTGALDQGSSLSEVKRNIFIGNGIGLRSANNVSTTVEDNLFIDNSVGIESSYQTQDIVRYNTFRNNNSYAIQTASLRSCLIEFNEIDGAGGIRNFWFTTPGQAPEIHNNNIKVTGFAIYTASQAAAQDIDATLNYYFTTNVEELHNLIWDEYDRQIEFPASYPAGYVLFEPFRTSKVLNAGIR